MIIDSAILACSGDPQSPEGVSSVIRPIRSFGTAALIVAHQPKNNLDSNKPFGSVFWSALPRSTVKVERKTDVTDGSLSILLTHTKNNNSSFEPPFAYRILHTEDTLTFESSDPENQFFSKLPVWKKIEKVMIEKDSAISVKDLVFATGENLITIARELQRHPDRFAVEKTGQGRGNITLWGVINKLRQNSESAPFAESAQESATKVRQFDEFVENL